MKRFLVAAAAALPEPPPPQSTPRDCPTFYPVRREDGKEKGKGEASQKETSLPPRLALAGKAEEVGGAGKRVKSPAEFSETCIVAKEITMPE